jgi:hypothetical protein
MIASVSFSSRALLFPGARSGGFSNIETLYPGLEGLIAFAEGE